MGGDFNNVMVDQPGIYLDAISRTLPYIYHRVDFFTCVYCTRGSAAGQMIKSVDWGIEMLWIKPLPGRVDKYWKDWWPITAYPGRRF